MSIDKFGNISASSPSSIGGGNGGGGNGGVGFVYFILVLAITASSMWHVLGKLALSNGMDASVFLVYRQLLSSLLMFAVSRFVMKVPLTIPHRIHWVRIVVLGVATCGNVTCFVYGLQLTTPFLCATMQPSVPVVVWLMSVAIGAERASAKKAFGVFLCSVGAMGAAASSAAAEADQDSSSFALGMMLLVAQCCMMACVLVFQPALLRVLHPLHVTGYLYLVGGCTALVLNVARQTLTAGLIPPPQWDLGGDKSCWIALAFCVICATTFTYGAMSWASQKVPATTVAVFLTVEPVTTSIISSLLLNAGPPNFLQTICAAAIAWGVFIVVKGGDTVPISTSGSGGYAPVLASTSSMIELAIHDALSTNASSSSENGEDEKSLSPKIHGRPESMMAAMSGDMT